MWRYLKAWDEQYCIAAQNAPACPCSDRLILVKHYFPASPACMQTAKVWCVDYTDAFSCLYLWRLMIDSTMFTEAVRCRAIVLVELGLAVSARKKIADIRKFVFFVPFSSHLHACQTLLPRRQLHAAKNVTASAFPAEVRFHSDISLKEAPAGVNRIWILSPPHPARPILFRGCISFPAHQSAPPRRYRCRPPVRIKIKMKALPLFPS